MGWIVDHTGKARFTRPAHSGPRYRWLPLSIAEEVEIAFNSFAPSFAFPTRRALICSTAAVGALGARMTMEDWMTLLLWTHPGARIDLGNKPWNALGQQTAGDVEQG